MNRIRLILLLVLLTSLSQAQAQTMAVVSKVEEINGKTVAQLKWFAVDFEAFKQLVNLGSTVERVEISAGQDPK